MRLSFLRARLRVPVKVVESIGVGGFRDLGLDGLECSSRVSVCAVEICLAAFVWGGGGVVGSYAEGGILEKDLL